MLRLCLISISGDHKLRILYIYQSFGLHWLEFFQLDLIGFTQSRVVLVERIQKQNEVTTSKRHTCTRNPSLGVTLVLSDNMSSLSDH